MGGELAFEATRQRPSTSEGLSTGLGLGHKRRGAGRRPDWQSGPIGQSRRPSGASAAAQAAASFFTEGEEAAASFFGQGEVPQGPSSSSSSDDESPPASADRPGPHSEVPRPTAERPRPSTSEGFAPRCVAPTFCCWPQRAESLACCRQMRRFVERRSRGGHFQVVRPSVAAAAAAEKKAEVSQRQCIALRCRACFQRRPGADMHYYLRRRSPRPSGGNALGPTRCLTLTISGPRPRP